MLNWIKKQYRSVFPSFDTCYDNYRRGMEQRRDDHLLLLKLEDQNKEREQAKLEERLKAFIASQVFKVEIVPADKVGP